MYKKGIEGFPYYLGINSLAEVAADSDRVCVLNILGGESRQVTPVSHAFSGGNVVFGTSPGRRGQVLATPIGDIPVYNNVREGLDDGLPSTPVSSTCRRPACATALPNSSASIRICGRSSSSPRRYPCTMPAKSARSARPTASTFSAAIASALRIPGTACASAARSAATIRTKCCSRARSRYFPTRADSPPPSRNISATEGWGTTTLISSGKDVYIHYALRDFAHALKNDARSQAAVLYSEPGGYYEHDVDFGKPVVACVVGRWKIQAHPRGGPRRCDGRCRRPRRGQGTLVHGGVRRR